MRSLDTIFFFFLTVVQEPKPETIRPYSVLQQTLVELKKRWKEKVSYNWICNQFKSLRQDLTVRHASLVCFMLTRAPLGRCNE
jgi:hypothetical protein